MERDHFVFEVMTEVRFTELEVGQLMEFSRRHYDSKCRSLSAQGGFIYGMKNQFWAAAGEKRPSTGTWKLSMSDLDILCKVTEAIVNQDIGKLPLHFKLKELFFEARDKYQEINAHLKEKT